MGKFKIKRNRSTLRVSPPTYVSETIPTAIQSKDVDSIGETSSVSMLSIGRTNYSTEHRDEQEIVQTVARKKTEEEEEAPEDDTESMIQALRTKLGLKQCCIDDADVACADDDVAVEYYQPPKVEKPQQHEKIVMQIDGSLAFLTFSRFAMVEESNHLLIKVRVGCLIHSCIWSIYTTF